MRMVKKWIVRVREMVWITGGLLFLMLGMTGCALGGADAAGMEGGTRWEDAWEKQSATTVASQTYTDATGNTIVYYCCKTTYYHETFEETVAESSAETTVGAFAENGGLDRNALTAVIDLDQASDHRDCRVGDWPAVLCRQGDRSYLCWTISPEYSCVIEYSADAVAEEDIFRMAESVVMK